MQNTSQTFRGAGAPGVNFSEHAYDNHVGVHCQPTGYQPYSNPPYHPIPSPRPHHYANHQMQPNMPYRHHGGAYAPNQNQYGQNMNQEVYRNHHSGYIGGPNSRNMPTKPWPENNASPDLMPPYGQVSHPQMMNNPSQMPVNSMRSPPHATSNMNPTPPQNQQHYRQMQSPAHSPHSWSQAQIPSPGVMHSSRTTPSPLPAHVRSPGHSQQPFSPPAAHAMSMPPHPQTPENGQIPPQPPMNPTSGSDNHNPSNPLHSLQKMVMLEQDPSKAMMPMMGDGSEQFANQCGSHNFVPDETAGTESKDSSYSTYYNMDENRFESKPNNAANDASAYSSVQQVSNCNFPMPSHPLNSEEVPNATTAPCSSSSNLHEVHHSAPCTSSPVTNSNSAAPLTQCKANVTQNDCALNLTECPPHAESAPVFTDQTKAAVSTNSEQALESKSSPNWTSSVSSTSSEGLSIDIPVASTAEEHISIPIKNSYSTNSDTASKSSVTANTQIKQEKNDEIKNPCIVSAIPADTGGVITEDFTCESDEVSTKDSDKNPLVNVQCKKENLDFPDKTNDRGCSNTIKLTAEVHKSDDGSETLDKCSIALKDESSSSEDSKRSSLRRRKVGANYEEAPSPETDLKDTCRTESFNSSIKDLDSPLNCDSSPKDPDSPDSKSSKDSSRNPVKVVIHRIRKDDTNDTWHVPEANGKECSNENSSGESLTEKKTESKIPNVGPQIIILSPAVSQKKFGFRSSVDSDNVITISEENSIIETIESNSSDAPSSSKKDSNLTNRNFNGSNSDKKRGRPVGSKNKLKPGCVKKKKGRKGIKKKKIELTKNKVVETPPKPKRIKNFSGPYVHIVGSKDKPTSIKVINVAQKEEEKLNKIQSKRNFSSTVNRIKKKQVGHLSTLSPTYDAFNRDKTWLCVFCHKGSHHGGLGDLYGPYYIKDKNPEKSSTASTSSSGSARRKRRKSEIDDSKGSKKARQNSGHTPVESTPVRSSSQLDDSLDADMSNLKEVWIHEDCAVWCQSISLIGEDVQGLEEAITEASENTCCHCNLQGATLGCWGKSCKQQYHFTCAKETGCQMDIEKFSLLCPQHQHRTHVSGPSKETETVVKIEKKSSERRTRCQ
ncbi:uncharacterized protein CG5098-like isoform X1 [Argiope bruennichi]|uniref:Transcription factor 20 like protein n=2 Tax=Argiope bruennichi TaxID=94029 RepID=A0A8T0FS48_ARGBR|nr:uncharacterized protein CG5098-like isoform X1 [Argiope bruennichi]KAF8793636.1 Transcription factor 20 like protein [Argiope bruennichi]